MRLLILALLAGTSALAATKRDCATIVREAAYRAAKEDKEFHCSKFTAEYPHRLPGGLYQVDVTCANNTGVRYQVETLKLKKGCHVSEIIRLEWIGR